MIAHIAPGNTMVNRFQDLGLFGFASNIILTTSSFKKNTTEILRNRLRKEKTALSYSIPMQ